MIKETLFGKTHEELKQIVLQVGLPAFTAVQLTQWLYKKKILNINEITNLSKKARETLSESYDIGIIPPTKKLESADGTKKFLFNVRNGIHIESAYIPENKRYTLCVSSQAGCKMKCDFCMTGKQRFQGNLTAGEIVNQIASIPENELITNVVYMGMGEPLDNYYEVLKSIKILTSEWGFAWSPRRINVSTIGIIPALKRLIEESEVHIAISLHSPFHEERKSLIPMEGKYPVTEVINTIREYDFGRQRKISFEYILFKDLNDTPSHIKGISKLLNGLRCRINLIKFHSIPGTTLQGCSHEKAEWFAGQLNAKNFTTTIRRSRGEDINAACGLLSSMKN